MLKKIKITNFYSIGEEQEISFEVSRKDLLDDSAREISKDQFLNLVTCVIGSNASGKTTILRALSFLCWFINESYISMKNEMLISVNPHILKQGEPTKLEIEFYNNDNFYKYIIEFNKKEVLEEKLVEKKSRDQNIFETTRVNNKLEIKTKIKINDTDRARFLERPNIPLLSFLINTGYLPEISFFKNFKSNVPPSGSFISQGINILNLSEKMDKNENLRQMILEFCKEGDLNIDDFEFSNIPAYNPQNQEPKFLRLLNLVHNSNIKKFTLPIYEESHGTQKNIYLLYELLTMLEVGGVVVIDEIESGLHPYLVKKLISLFERKNTNPKNAQLIFSTHQHVLLNDRLKTQIFIVEKDNGTSESIIYCLNEIEGIRNDENFTNKYLSGTYGGIPKVKGL